jgi:uncharacterized protein
MEGDAGRRRGMTARRPRTRRAERGMSLERLDRWLDTLDPPARVEGVSMLDGYLTAIIVGPRSVPPEEWFDDLFGARGHIASASGTMLMAITTIVARFNAISQGLSTAPDRHAPIFRKTDDGQALPHLWCMGFLTGMRLRMDAWQPLLDLNRVDHGLLLPILLYCIDPSGQPMLGPPGARGRKRKSSFARRIRTSRSSSRRSATSSCRKGRARRTVNPDEVCQTRTGYERNAVLRDLDHIAALGFQPPQERELVLAALPLQQLRLSVVPIRLDVANLDQAQVGRGCVAASLLLVAGFRLCWSGAT